MRDFSHVPGDPMRQTPPGLPRSLLLCLLTTGSLGTSTPATAQMRVEAVPDSVLRPYSVRAADPTVGTLAAVRSAPKLSASAPRFRDYSWLGGAVQVEGPRETFDGRYTRPKVVVGVPSEGTLHEVAEAATRIAESRRIRQVLKQTGGNKTRAAEVLQVSYKTLLTKIKEYRLEEKAGAE